MTALGGSHGTSYERVVSAIKAVSGAKEQRGAGYIKVCCPAHADKNPSVSVTYDAAKGRTKVHCFSGCHDEDILSAAGLKIADLFDEPLPEQSPRTSPRRPAPSRNSTRGATKPAPSAGPGSKPRSQEAADEKVARKAEHTYVYQRADGTKIGKVVRHETFNTADIRLGKRFLQYHFDEEKRRWTSGKFEPLVYHLPEVAAAIAAGQIVYLVEGEKDADTAKSVGQVGTTNAQGAGQFRQEHAEQLRGAAVVQVVDRDIAGYRHAIKVRALLQPAGEDALVASYQCVESTSHKDFTEHVQAGKTIADLTIVDPVARFCDLALDVARASIDASNNPKAERQLEEVRDLLEQVQDGAERNRLSTILTNLGGRLAPPPVEDELASHRRARRPAPDPEDEGDLSEPQWLIPTGSGSWAYSTGEDGDGLERGVYRYNRGDWQLVAPLPHVFERLTARTGDRTRAGMSYRIAMSKPAEAEEVALVSDDEVKTGIWADKLDVALSADSKVLAAAATAIRDTARKHAEARELVPRWIKGRIEMPPSDVGAVGYGELAGDEATAKKTWRTIIDHAKAAPKLALFLGAGIGAVYVQPLERQSFVLLGTGQGRRGKSTGLRCSAAIYGDWKNLIRAWNTSTIGLTQTLGNRALLPSFFDELAAAGLKGRDLEKIVFQITEGAQRTIGGKDGHSPKTSAPWHGILFSASNDSILGEIANEGTAARVLEIGTPITRNAADAKALTKLTRESYGWPLHWLLKDPDLDGFAGLIEQAQDDIGMPDGGVPETIAEHLALTAAGARRLELMVDAEGLYEAAIDAGKQLLDDLVAELNERGASADIRLVTATIEAFHARPAAFPTRAAYRKHLAGEFGNGPQVAREVEGWNLTQDPDYQGDLALTKKALWAIATEAGIHDPYPALRQLRAGGRLIVDKDGKSRYQGSVKTTPDASKSIKLYVFVLDEDERAIAQELDDDSDDTAAEVASTRTNTPADHAGSSPLSPHGTTSPQNSGDDPDTAVTRTDTPLSEVDPVIVPTVPTLFEESPCAMNEERKEGRARPGQSPFNGPNGPLWFVDDEEPWGVCRHCGKSCPTFDTVGWAHVVCAHQAGPSPAHNNPPKPNAPEPEASAPTPASTSVPATAAEPTTSTVVEEHVALSGPVAPRPVGFRAACAVLDPTGIYLPDGVRYRGVPIADALDILTAGEKLRLGHPNGAGQLILTDAMCVELGLVAEADSALAGDAARDQVRERLRELGEPFLERARHEGWELGNLNVENRVRRRSDDRMLEIVLAPYEYLWTRGREDAHPLGALDENLSEEQYAAEAARIMGYLAHRLKAPWRGNPGQVGWDIYDRAQRGRKRRKGHVLTDAGVLPKLTGDVKAADIVPQLSWSRWTAKNPASTEDQALIDGARFAVHLDRMAAWCASAKESSLGYVTADDPMRHVVGANAVAELLQRPEAVPAGLFRLLVPPAENPAIPPLHAKQSPTEPRWLWLPAPLVSGLLYSDDPSNTTLGWGCSPDALVTPDPKDPEARQAESWVFPAQGRLLDGEWYETLRDARYGVEQDGDKAAERLIKRIYSAMLQSAEGPETERILTGKRPWKIQATWLSTTKGAHYSRQWNLSRRAIHNGLLVASVQIDEVVILVDDPAKAVLGKMDGLVGQYRVKTVRELTDEHRAALAAGKPAHELTGGEVEL